MVKVKAIWQRDRLLVNWFKIEISNLHSGIASLIVQLLRIHWMIQRAKLYSFSIKQKIIIHPLTIIISKIQAKLVIRSPCRSNMNLNWKFRKLKGLIMTLSNTLMNLDKNRYTISSIQLKRNNNSLSRK